MRGPRLYDFFYSLLYHVIVIIILTFISFSFPLFYWEPLYPFPHSCPLFLFAFFFFPLPPSQIFTSPCFISCFRPSLQSLPFFLHSYPPTSPSAPPSRKKRRIGGHVPLYHLLPGRCHRLSDTCLFTSSPVCPYLPPRPRCSSLPSAIRHFSAQTWRHLSLSSLLPSTPPSTSSPPLPDLPPPNLPHPSSRHASVLAAPIAVLYLWT